MFSALKYLDKLESCQFVEEIEYESLDSMDAELDYLVTSIEEEGNEGETMNLISTLNQNINQLILATERLPRQSHPLKNPLL